MIPTVISLQFEKFSFSCFIINYLNKILNRVEMTGKISTHLRSLLSFDGVAGAGEAELVVRLGGALHEVRVFESLLAERAFE